MRISLATRRAVVGTAISATVVCFAPDGVGALIQQAKLAGSDRPFTEGLGLSVAVLGDTAVVGSGTRIGLPNVFGAAYVFKREGTTWTQEARLLASDAAPGDRTGSAVAIAGDTVVVGAPGKSTSQGAVYVFTRSGTTWTEQAKLTTSVPVNGDSLGASVSISGDTVFAGAPEKFASQGAVYVFKRTGTTWAQEAKLTIAGAAPFDHLGRSVAVEGDTAVAGAYGGTGTQGAAYVFTRTGTTWTQEAKLTAANPANADRFGWSVSLSGDTVVASAIRRSSPGLSQNGAVFVFTRTATIWTQQAELVAADAASGEELGFAVGVSGDTAVAGSAETNASQGAVYVFTRTGASWTQQTKLAAEDAAGGDNLGTSVAFDGETTVAGAPGEQSSQGAAYVFASGVAPPPPPPPITSFFLPKKVTAKVSAAAAGKSTLTADGIFDTGPDAPDFASAATLDVGGLHFDIPGLSPAGKGFAFTGNGATFSIAPNPYGSSRAKFKLKYTGDLTGKVALNGPLGLHFDNAITDGGGTVDLDGGAFGLGKVAGALIQPNLFVVRAHANLKGAGKDALAVIVGLATGGVTPPAASDLSVGFGANVTATIPAASFVRKGTTDTFTGNAGGITKVVVDYAREQIAVTGKALTLETFAPGGNPVLLTVGLGTDVRAVLVRMGRIGNTMKY